MLSEFVSDHRSEIIERCRARVMERMPPSPATTESEAGIPIFLDQLAATLRRKLTAPAHDAETATTHGESLLRRGFTIGEVVHDYGDVCQTITEMAIERKAPITTDEFRLLNMCLDDAIAEAVGEFGRQQALDTETAGAARATEDLGHFAHELRNLIATATLACHALRSGTVGIAGSTGAVLERSLVGLAALVDRSLSLVRLDAGIVLRDRVLVRDLLQEIEASALLDANARGHHLVVVGDHADAAVVGDRQILTAIVMNLIQNAFKFTRAHSQVVLRAIAAPDRVRIEVEDHCGGLAPGSAATMFEPFKQEHQDRTGLGLGLAICKRGAEALGGTIDVRDLPGQGCVFGVEFPLAPIVSAQP